MIDDFTYAKKFTVVDARSAGRFGGKLKEPREGLRSGHSNFRTTYLIVPGSLNVPFGELITPEGTLKSEDELIQIFKNSKVAYDRSPIVTMCGSGVTGAILYLALNLLGVQDLKLYDGSWTDYASRKESAIRQYP